MKTMETLVQLGEAFESNDEFTTLDYYHKTGKILTGTTIRALVHGKCLEKHLHSEPGRKSKSYYTYTFTDKARVALKKLTVSECIT